MVGSLNSIWIKGKNFDCHKSCELQENVMALKRFKEKCPMCKGKGFLNMSKGTIEDLKKEIGL
jgi:hypothetical protein